MAKKPLNISGSVDDVAASLEQERAVRVARQPGSVAGWVYALYDTLIGMRNDGWSDAEICKSLTSRGIDVSLGTFSKYMRRAEAERSGSASAPSKKSPSKRDSGVARDSRIQAKNNSDLPRRASAPEGDSVPDRKMDSASDSVCQKKSEAPILRPVVPAPPPVPQRDSVTPPEAVRPRFTPDSSKIVRRERPALEA